MNEGNIILGVKLKDLKNQGADKINRSADLTYENTYKFNLIHP